ncbi:MAG: cell division protein FtsZ [Cytophagales bacterium]
MNYKFEIPNINKSIIKVIGVGGGGGNAVSYMFKQGIVGVEFIVCNTDAQALKASEVPNKFSLGNVGLGAGSKPEKARQFAIDDKDKIREVLEGTKMLFITAGMGGGTGTGAAPVIAKIAKEMDILTVGIVTMPFTFEGNFKKKIAIEGIEELRANCDAVLEVINDRLYEIFPKMSFKEAFTQADKILLQGAKSIAEIIGDSGFINIDLEDVNTVLKEAGTALMGFGMASGAGKAERAADLALHSPLLNNTDILGATKILVSVTADEELFEMEEFAIINNYFQEKAGDAFLKPGVRLVKDFGDQISVTVIATGFVEAEINRLASRTVIDLNSNRQTSIFEDSPAIKNRPSTYKPMQEEEPILEASNGIFRNPAHIERVVLDLDGGKPTESRHYTFESPQIGASSVSDYQDLNKEKRKKQEENYTSRSFLISERTTFSAMNPEEYKEMNETPAFIRRKKQIYEAPHSSEKNISRFSLNEDNEILGNNKFLHDNVD